MKKKKGTVRSDRPAKKYKFEIASREQLLAELSRAGKPLTHEQLAATLKIYDREEKFDALGRRLGAMVRDGQIVRNRRGGFLTVDEQNLIRGRVSAHADGYGFLVNEHGGDDIFISARQMRSVLDGDRVVVHITGIDRRGRSEGAIVEVLARANETVLGRLRFAAGVVLREPENKRIHQDIVITDAANGRDGQIGMAVIDSQPTAKQPPIGHVTEVLGEHLAPGMEIDVAIRARGIPEKFSRAALTQSKAFGDAVDPEEAASRRDLRKFPLVTIDGEDARDFDDAVYAQRKDYGWRLLVAIADVSHYVTPDSALDEDAADRGTSVYFPQQVVPMLPESLSNGLCSLNPDVDRLCMVADLAIGTQGEIRRSRFYPAVMCSKARLTYTRVQQYLTSREGDIPAEIQPHLDVLYELFQVLQTVRTARGAIDFESNETRIVFNSDRKIQSLQPIVRNDAHRLIEECMITANIAAARFIGKRKIPGLYRIHEGPGADKLLDLRKFLSLRGLSLSGGDTPQAADYARTLADAQGRSDVKVIQTVLLRSMNRAVYSVGNSGHFGLALTEYAHFTSPIRRYPDLMVHRAIKHLLIHRSADGFPYTRAGMADIAEHCSVVERRAEEAVRDVVAWLKCEYMQDRIGASYSGVISAVTSFGVFVELDDVHVEGLIHISSLPRDYYDFDAGQQQLVGRASGRIFALGQTLLATVAAVNLDERKIDLLLAEKGLTENRAGTPVEQVRKKRKSRGAKPKSGSRRKGKSARRSSSASRKRTGQPSVWRHLR